MIKGITGYNLFNNSQNYIINKQRNEALSSQSINFTGMSRPQVYKNTFDYISAKIIESNPRKWGLDGSFLSATKIKAGLDKLFQSKSLFSSFSEAKSSKINWRNYIPQDVREYCVNKINSARRVRLNEWQSFLEDPDKFDPNQKFPRLTNEIKNNQSLKFTIWATVNNELTANNRHIPVPLDLAALNETVNYFKTIQPIFRAQTCFPASFISLYTHRLVDNVLTKKGFSKEQDVWVKIPSAKHDSTNLKNNVSDLEVLSYKNWCTRSSVDKAEDALADGDFYLYLRKDSRNVWQTIIGMASSRGMIDQIQGRDNNNYIPITEAENVKAFIKSRNLQCRSGVFDDGPKAYQQVLIADKLNEYNETVGKTLNEAIKGNDVASVLKIAGCKVKYTPDGLLELKKYKPQILLSSKQGIVVPYSFMGINEDVVLEKVEKINGDFNLYNKNSIFSSRITTFPPNLKEVGGRVVCTKEQYEQFKEDIHRVVKDENRIIIKG